MASSRRGKRRRGAEGFALGLGLALLFGAVGAVGLMRQFDDGEDEGDSWPFQDKPENSAQVVVVEEIFRFRGGDAAFTVSAMCQALVNDGVEVVQLDAERGRSGSVTDFIECVEGKGIEVRLPPL